MRRPPSPKRPTHIPDYAEVCLAALVAHGLGDKVSLGGAFALLHYLDYRSTYDVDAWWQLSATTQDRQQVVNVLEQTLQLYGTVRIRSFGDVTSIELATDVRKISGRWSFGTDRTISAAIKDQRYSPTRRSP